MQNQPHGSAMKLWLIGTIRSAHCWWWYLHHHAEFWSLKLGAAFAFGIILVNRKYGLFMECPQSQAGRNLLWHTRLNKFISFRENYSKFIYRDVCTAGLEIVNWTCSVSIFKFLSDVIQRIASAKWACFHVASRVQRFNDFRMRFNILLIGSRQSLVFNRASELECLELPGAPEQSPSCLIIE